MPVKLTSVGVHGEGKILVSASEGLSFQQPTEHAAGGDRPQRNEKDLGRKFPVVKDSIAALDVRDAFIDGEIVVLDEKGRPSFQALQGFDMGQEWPPIVFYAFDLLQLNGKDLRNLPIEERKVEAGGAPEKGARRDSLFDLVHKRH